MGFRDMLDTVGKLAGPASEAAAKYLDEFNAALPVMQALGFTVEDVQVTMGLLPEISAKLIAAAADINVKALDDMIQKKSDQKTLVAVLKALQTAYNVRDQLGDLGLKGIEIDVTLGLPPKISIGFLKTPATVPPSVVTASA
jgi:predicted regulator of amino acid metabolism with ACT domain